MEHAAILKRMGLFRDLDSLELIQVSKRVKHRKVKAGERVLSEGEPGHSLYVVKAGRFRAFTDHGGGELELGRFEQADGFGELALIDQGPRSATVEALSEGELLEFDREAYESLMAHSEALQMKLLKNLVRDLAQKLRRTDDQFAKLL
jgi:CRP-like cAMP-binding protein